MIPLEIIIVILAVLAAAGTGVATWLALKSRIDTSQANLQEKAQKVSSPRLKRKVEKSSWRPRKRF